MTSLIPNPHHFGDGCNPPHFILAREVDPECAKVSCDVCRMASYEVGFPTRMLKPHFCASADRWEEELREKVQRAVNEQVPSGVLQEHLNDTVGGGEA